jgi:enamine deaminase RidA (YjgF/YER057c/UK114 family)
MRSTVFRSMGREFVSLSAEAPATGSAGSQMHTLVAQMEGELQKQGLALADTVRTRLWARDRPARNEASTQRRKIFEGALRSVSSSFIAPDIFSSDSSVALDLLAMRPSGPDSQKILREYDPPIVPLNYLIRDGVVFLSGMTAVLPTLEDQIADIVPRITHSLQDAGTTWERVAIMSCYLHTSQRVESLMALLKKAIPADIRYVEIGFAEGYSDEGKLIEIETTALAATS